ncbi:hypothetical protein OOZ58_20460 [Streptomyces tauricus]|nr:hypothetical protein [Streptomyces tauricus]
MCEVGESADVVHLHVAFASTDLAGIRQESRDEFLLRIVHPDRLTIGKFRRSLPLEGNPAEPCHQWLPVLPFNSGLEADSGPVGGIDSGLVLSGHLRYWRTVLCGKGFEHGCLHNSLQPVQPEDISGKQVVLDNAPVYGPERCHDRMIAAVDQGRSLRGVSAGEVGGALGFDHVPWDTQSDLAVDSTVTASLLRVIVLGRDLVTEESGCPGAGMSDQRLFLGQFQIEVVTQELGQVLLDLLGLGFRSGETKEMIVRLCRAPGYADCGGDSMTSSVPASEWST